MQPTLQSERVLSFNLARGLVESHARNAANPASEVVPLEEAAGRFLATAVRADRDLPPFHRSTRDGYALVSADAQAAPARLRLLGSIRAGESSPLQVAPGSCVEIMTGAPLPPGADGVIMLEFTRPAGEFIECLRPVAKGENVVTRGSEAAAGSPLLLPGSRLGPAEIALLASVGATQVTVARRPRVTILATGDEVVAVAATPAAHQIRNSNTPALAAMARRAGGDVIALPIAPDEPARLRELLGRGLEADLLLIAGGVSAGKFDLVEPALADFHAEIFFTGALIQPGRPIVFGRAARPSGGNAYFFGLPGNPVSAIVTFQLFVAPLLQALAGAAATPLRTYEAQLTEAVRVKAGLTRFLPALMEHHGAARRVTVLAWQGSGDLVALSRANCYVVVPAECEGLAEGASVSVVLRST